VCSDSVFVETAKFSGVLCEGRERWAPHGWWSETYAALHMFFGWLVVPLMLASLAGVIKR
jgi:hypothetical protein